MIKSPIGRLRYWAVGAMTAVMLSGFALFSPSLTPAAEASCCPGMKLSFHSGGYTCSDQCEHGWACCQDE